MTSILRYTTAEWKKQLARRGLARRDRGRAGGADIVIFPGVRVEYCQTVEGHDASVEHGGQSSERRGRLELGPARRPTVER